MKELSKTQQIVMAIGALLMVAGVGCYVFNIVPKVSSVVFSLGAVVFAVLQMMQASYIGNENITVRRLKGIMVMGDICFIIAGLLMLENSYMWLYGILPWDMWVKYCWNNWVVALLIAAIIEMYTSHRISYELKKENK